METQDIEKFKKDYPFETNVELAKNYNLTPRQVERWGIKYGLHKDVSLHQKQQKEAEMKDQLKEKYGLTKRQLDHILASNKQKVIKPLALQLGAGKVYRFGAIADTHLCSCEEELRALHTFYRVCQRRGIKQIYHAGDLVAAQGVYAGQEYEVKVFGADNQVNYFCEHYPKVPGITTYFIMGNHDYAYVKQMGINIGTRIAEKRHDMKYIGAFQGDVKYHGITLIRLVHPDGGMPYALSYRAQKYVEQIASGSKPRILLMGHLHTQYHFIYRNIAVYGCGCFEGQTTLLARKGINPVIGGWIITIRFGKDRKHSAISIISEFIPFYG
jgi:predicted phosphodiesterase